MKVWEHEATEVGNSRRTVVLTIENDLGVGGLSNPVNNNPNSATAVAFLILSRNSPTKTDPMGYLILFIVNY